MISELAELVMPNHSAVLVIDVQNDCCHPDGAYAKRGRDISLRQKAAHNAADFVREARKYAVPIIFVKLSHGKWDEAPAWKRRRKQLGPPVCMEGTWGAEFYAVEPVEGDAIVVKHRYSAFIGTDLDLILRSKRISTLIVTGGGTHVCVESTVRDGFMLDYDIVMVSDCCGSTTLDEHLPALKRMARLCGTVVEAKEVLEAWSSAGEKG